MRYARYHALGNEYIVVEPDDLVGDPAEVARRLCDRETGVGADGILVGPGPSEACDHAVLIFNTDGSRSGNSGNGLRILARHLLETGRIEHDPFTVETEARPVTCQVSKDGSSVRVELGPVSFSSDVIPMAGPVRDVLEETIEIALGIARNEP